MSTYRLDRLFAPASVALVGASARPGSLGHAVLANLRRANPSLPPIVVNPNHREIDGLPCLARLADVAHPVDLAVIAVPAQEVAAVVDQACAGAAATAVILTAGLGHGEGSIAERVRLAARRSGLRLVGPNCIGVASPRARLDASFLSKPAREGNLALISQSGAIAASLVEWAHDNAVGFSGVVSLGDQIDVDFGDCLDHFALDARTRAILLYIESVGDARKFLSAARAAARAKPVIVAKAGRHAEGARAALSHTGAMTGSDAVYDAAFARAGLLRVADLEELFAAAETLSRRQGLSGERIGFLTNGGGLGVLAVDRLADFGGAAATLSQGALDALSAVLPSTWSHANPVDIIGDADAARYCAAMDVLLASDDIDALVVLNCPTALVSSAETAAAVAERVETSRKAAARSPSETKPVFAAWFGDRGQARATFEGSQIPHYDSEVDAVRGVMHLVAHRRLQKALLAAPPRAPLGPPPDAARARRIVDEALAAGETWLSAAGAAGMLEAYGVPVAETREALSRAEAVAIAGEMLNRHDALAVKVLSADILHKSDVGGVRLHMRTAAEVGAAYDDMRTRIAKAQPSARVRGVTLQAMVTRPGAVELILGLADDPTFGPVLLFGHGGVAVAALDDRALALPPLDLALARDLISRTRVSRLLAGYRDVPPADIGAVAGALVRLGQLSADIAEIRELDINPLLADAAGAVALDVRIRIAARAPGEAGAFNPRFAIRPYPGEWEGDADLPEGLTVHIRPLRPEDAALYAAFFARVTPADMHRRFFSAMANVTPELVARLTQIDYSRTMALIALDKADGALLGVVRLHCDANHDTGEFGILVRSDLKGRGLGWTLMRRCIDFAKSEGIGRIDGDVLADNDTMLTMCREFGFTLARVPEADDIVRASLALRPTRP